jgi:hypothetical protein
MRKTGKTLLLFASVVILPRSSVLPFRPDVSEIFRAMQREHLIRFLPFHQGLSLHWWNLREYLNELFQQPSSPDRKKWMFRAEGIIAAENLFAAIVGLHAPVYWLGENQSKPNEKFFKVGAVIEQVPFIVDVLLRTDPLFMPKIIFRFWKWKDKKVIWIRHSEIRLGGNGSFAGRWKEVRSESEKIRPVKKVLHLDIQEHHSYLDQNSEIWLTDRSISVNWSWLKDPRRIAEGFLESLPSWVAHLRHLRDGRHLPAFVPREKVTADGHALGFRPDPTHFHFLSSKGAA